MNKIKIDKISRDTRLDPCRFGGRPGHLIDRLDDTELDIGFLTAELPSEVQRNADGLLRNIQTSGYYWRPFSCWSTPGQNPVSTRRCCEATADL